MSKSAEALQKVLMTYNKTAIIKESLIAKKKAAIIKEAKEAKQIKKQQKEVLPTEVQKKVQEVSTKVQLDETQKNFINKFIEYSELTLLNKSNEELIKTFEKSLGTNASAAIEELDKKTKERQDKIAALAKQLTAIKEQIVKETEKAQAKATLVSLYDSVEVPVKDKPEKQDKVTTLDPTQINIVENKKKTK